MMRPIALACLLALAACSTPSQRIATSLTSYGMAPAQARCMGDRLQSRLTMSELRRLENLSRLAPAPGGRVNINDLARALDDPDDQRVAAEVLKAGFSCLL